MFNTFKALADPTRIKILELLKQKGMTAGEIAKHFDMKKPSISHHLSILSHANLIYSEKRGQYVHYTLNMTMLQEIMKWIMTFQNN
ncbi:MULTISPECIES: autorepressor SdpR family transcription factor [Heyndrickxia]|uniref:autorepressor SdpR family transcription factor n=1 Tax=Heyndrickxia TaxID=2837504 RepID=UPI002DB9E212|nr:autorepressor SdpR family transcription factor [Weizmannia sp. CD-2023]MEC2224875.1 autorepressor SdpR family transcription factor [Weizmannia sp. CD-2023]